MNITFNNNITEIKQDTTLSEFIESNGMKDKNIAVALNNSVVPKTLWDKTTLKEGDNILIIKAFYGG